MQHPGHRTTPDGLFDYATFILGRPSIAPFEIDLHSGAVACTAQLSALFAYPAEHALTLEDCLARCHPDDRATLAEAPAASSQGAQFDRTFRIVRPGSDTRWLRAIGEIVFDGQGQAIRAHGVAADITEQRQADLALQHDAARLRLALDIAELGTWSWDLVTSAAELDERGAAIVGLPPGKHQSASDLQRERVHPDDLAQLESDIAAGIASGEVFNLDYRVIYADGSIHHVISRAHVFADAAGRPIRLVGTNRDITAERMAEATLRASEERYRALYAQEQAARAEAEEANRLKDEFLATVSHELRTPLTALLGYAELLQRRKRDEAYVSRTIEKMAQSAKSQAALIDDLLDVSRIVNGKLRIDPQPLVLGEIVQAALDTIRPTIEARNLQLQVDLAAAADAVFGDANRLKQVVWNLLTNAAKFTPNGGKIVVQLARAGNDAELRITDSGQGIAPEFLPHVFERFRQADSTTSRSSGGLGLGLSIVRQLVELHGGSVTATSAGAGQGAMFTVRLPLIQAAGPPAALVPPSASETAEGTPLALGGLRVLIAEDQPEVLDMLEEAIAANGATVRACADAQSALALVPAWRPDVLVSDIAMPGEDGYWLIKGVRALPAGQGGATPAIALTAYLRTEDQLQVLAAGFQHYLPKPVTIAELRDAILHLAVPQAQ